MTLTQLKKFLLRIIGTDGYVLGRNGDDLEGKSVGTETIKGWINFCGIGTIAINDSFNVSGITDLGVGYYRVSWDTDFADAKYAASVNVCGIGYSDWNAAFSAIYSTAIDVTVFDVSVPGFVDPNICMVMAIGDQ